MTWPVLGFAVAHALDASAPAVEGLDAEAMALAQRIADALLAAKRPLIIAGTSLGSKALIEAAANIAKALKLREKNGSISLIVPEANSLGLAMLGGESVDSALQAVIDGKADALVVLENDLYTRTDSAKVDAALNAAKVLIVADHQKTATSERADLVLPAATFAEGDGTLVSQEGRAQRFFQVFDPKYMDASILVHEGWRWLHALRSTLLNQPIDWTQLDHVTAVLAASAPQLARIVDAAPSAAFRIKGMKLAREPLRYSGSYRMRPTSACMNRVLRKTTTPRSPSPWKVTRVRSSRVSRCHLPGRRAGTRRRPGTSSRTKSVVTSALATRARA